MISLCQKFNILEISETQNGFPKILSDKKDLLPVLSFLMLSEKYKVDMLLSIIAHDLGEKIELIYNLYSSSYNKHYLIAVRIYSDNPIVESVSHLFKSAVFDEREIFDLFGVEFEKNDNLKRLLLPVDFVGNPLLKSFKMQNNERQNNA